MSQSIVMIEGFDHYDVNGLGPKGWANASISGASMVTGRYNGQGVNMPAGNTAFMTKALPAAYTTAILGLALKVDKLGNADIFILKAGATNTCVFRVNASGRIEVRNSSGTLIATGTAALSLNIWYFLEFKLVVNGASGSIASHVNGVADIATTTGNFGSTGVDALDIGTHGFSSGYTQSFDDIRVGDGTTGSTADYPGDTRVDTIAASADGVNTGWTPSTGASRAANVDEMSGTFPNGDTDYNSATAVGTKDTYDMGALASGAGQILAIQPVFYAKKDDAGTRTVAPVIRHSGTDYDGTAQGVGASYAFFSQIYEAMPNADALTKARVDAAEFGVKVIA